MGRPYNFLQYSATGSGFFGSGLVSAYPDNFTGFFIPKGVFDTANALTNNIEETERLGILISGFIPGSNIDLGFGVISLSGGFFKANHESGSFYFSFTGKQEEGIFDKFPYSFSITGSIDDGNIDLSPFNIHFSGSMESPIMDSPSFSLAQTGEFAYGNIDNPSYYIGISGSFDGPIMEQASSFGASIGAMEWGITNQFYRRSGSDTGCMAVSIGSMTWSWSSQDV